MSTFFRALEQAARERATGVTTPLPPAASPRGPRPGPPGVPPLTAGAIEPPQPVRPRGEELAEPDPTGIDEHLVSLLSPGSFEAEQYRALRHLVEHLHKTAGLSVVAVSSAVMGDGKTTTAINLAGALAQTPDARVLLVDADLRGAAVARRLGLPKSSAPTLVDAIRNPTVSLADAVRQCPPFNLALLPAGEPARAPYEVLKSPRLGELLDEARRHYDYVILDTAPVVSVPDTRVLEKCVDGILLVVTAHRTPRRMLDEALVVLEAAKVVGLVFNGDERPLTASYYYPYPAASPSRNGSGSSGWGTALTALIPRRGARSRR